MTANLEVVSRIEIENDMPIVEVELHLAFGLLAVYSGDGEADKLRIYDLKRLILLDSVVAPSER
ncbi:MAG: hypothetical protein AAB305_05735, partial [Candidatus Zixiibacteriota bacterium]